MDKTLGPTAENSVAKAPGNTKFSWKGGSSMKQNFVFPDTLIYYIAMNPSNPQLYNKLIQTCKYFFERNPILVAPTMTEKVICSNVTCRGNEECCIKMDIEKITSKIWLTGTLTLHENVLPNFTALLRPKIYRCDIFGLCFYDRTVDFEDFKYLALSTIIFGFITSKIVSNNGDPVLLENILEALPNVQIFKCHIENNDSLVTATTAKNLSKLKNLRGLKKLTLNNISEAFCFDDLFAFIKDQSNTEFLFEVTHDISEEYKNQLDQFIDLLIESQLSNCCIAYHGQNQEKLRILARRFCANFE